MEAKKKIKVLDLFCKAGGASWGMYWVDPKNLEITGSDIELQPRYPFNFIQSDFRNIKLDEYDFIWASPPCQRYSRMTPTNKKQLHPDYITELRSILNQAQIPYCIENVPCSPLQNYIKLTGEMFGYEFNKERWFETSFFIMTPAYRRRYGSKPFIHTSNRSDRVKAGLEWMNHDEYKNAVCPDYSYYIFSNWLLSQNRHVTRKTINCFSQEGF